MDEANEQMASTLDETLTRRDTFCYARAATRPEGNSMAASFPIHKFACGSEPSGKCAII